MMIPADDQLICSYSRVSLRNSQKRHIDIIILEVFSSKIWYWLVGVKVDALELELVGSKKQKRSTSGRKRPWTDQSLIDRPI